MSNRTRANSRADLLSQKILLDSQPVYDRPRPKARSLLIGFFTNRVADFFTLLRVMLGFVLFLAGFIDGHAALAKDIWLLVIAWSTDMVDGRISRSLKTAGKTWLGKNDVYVDMFVSLTVLLYLTVTGLLAPVFLFVYLLVWSVIFLRWGIQPLFAQVFQNPIYALFVFLTLQSAPHILPLLLLWAFIALIFFWRRLFELLKGVVNTVTQ